MHKLTAIIFTGGDGTRMYPLSLDRSKSMVPFMGKALVLHLVKSLKAHGFSKIIFTTPGKHDEIKRFFMDGSQFGVTIKYFENNIGRGTAGILKLLVKEMDEFIESDDLVVIYGDSLIKVDYEAMLEFHKSKNSYCTLLSQLPNLNALEYKYHNGEFDDLGRRTNYGVMEITSDGRIAKFEEKPLFATISEEFKKPYASATVYMIKKRLLDYIPDGPIFDLPKDLFPLLIENGVECFGFYDNKGYWVDIGTIPVYFTFQIAILNQKVDFFIDYPTAENGVWIGNKTYIVSSVNLLKPVLICENCDIKHNTTITNSIIGNNVYIGKGCNISTSIILDKARIGDNVNISDSIIGESCIIANNTLIPSNTVLGHFNQVGEENPEILIADFL